tara:strand:- start:1767 stop:2999 length:1233 start_codon:yes stop_codon:yes gene_type:complete
MILSEVQREVADDKHRFKVVCAGRRWGKTYLAMREICYQAREPNKNIFYITTSYRAAKMIMWKPLKQKLLELKWVRKINESELQITLKNNTTISLKGSEDPDRIRGISASFVCVDEAASCDLDALWGEVLRPALADQQGGALFIGTPMGKSNPFYDLWLQGERDPDTWASWQFTTISGGRVTEQELEAAKHDMTDSQFKQEFLASWETAQNLVAWEFNRDENIKELPDNDHSVLEIGCDFNVSPITASIMTRRGEDLYAIDEIVMYNSNTQELAQEIRNRYPRSRITVYPDPAGSARKSSANGQTDHTILENAGFKVKSPRRHDPVRDRINASNARLRTADGVRHAFIAKKCKYTIECLEKHSFKKGTQIPDKGDWDHMFDAWSYCIAYLYPLRKHTPPIAPQRWGTKIT